MIKEWFSPFKKSLLISDIDLDGNGAMVLSKYFKIPYTKIVAYEYGWELNEDLFNEVLSYDIIHFVDKSIPKEFFDKLIEKGIEVHVYDHHETSEWLKEEEYTNIHHDLLRCGTKIYFEDYILPHVHNRAKDIIFYFVDLVNTFDLWRKDYYLWDEALNLNRVLYKLMNWKEKDNVLRSNAFFKHTLNKFEKLNKWKWLDLEVALINQAKDLEEKAYKHIMNNMQYRKDSKDRNFGLSIASSKISVSCDRILGEIPEMDYLIICNEYQGLNGQLHFRTQRDDFSIPSNLCIAGGHAKAAGGSITIEETIKLLDGDYWSISYLDEFEKDQNIFRKIENV